MRFAVGQAFESAVSGRQAVVTETRDDGHAGHLCFLDNGQRRWVLWAQFLHAGEWLPIGMRRRRHLRRPHYIADPGGADAIFRERLLFRSPADGD